MPVVTERTAFLRLPGHPDLSLHDPDGGYALQNLTIGYPAVREVVNNWADRSGADDQTQFYGPRTVTADITAFMGEGQSVDEITSRFGPYMSVTARPTLIWTPRTELRSPLGDPRMLALRAADFTAVMDNIAIRSIHLGWVCPDPVAYALDENDAMAFAGSDFIGGRAYLDGTMPTNAGPPTVWNNASTLSYDPAELPEDLQPKPPEPHPPGALAPFTWNAAAPVNWDGGTVGGVEALWGVEPPIPPSPGVRWFPPGGQIPTNGWIVNRGDMPIRPLLRIHGPVNEPVVWGDVQEGDPDDAGAVVGRWQIVGQPGLAIPSQRWLDIDTAAKTATWDTGAPALALVNWMDTTWPAIGAYCFSDLRMRGDTTHDETQVWAFWRTGWFL